MRRLLAVLVAALVFAPAALAAGPTIYVENTSTTVTDAQIANALPAFQASVSQDLASYWGTDATLVQAPAPAGAWKITVSDDADVLGALGYHWLTAGVPYGDVFARTSLVDGESWQLVFDHELKEMLVDPFANRATLAARIPNTTRRWWLTEVGDPVEASRYEYYRQGLDGNLVQLSDFITPAWYGGGSGRYDFMGRVKHPLQILSGGYANYWLNGAWKGIQVQ